MADDERIARDDRVRAVGQLRFERDDPRVEPRVLETAHDVLGHLLTQDHPQVRERLAEGRQDMRQEVRARWSG